MRPNPRPNWPFLEVPQSCSCPCYHMNWMSTPMAWLRANAAQGMCCVNVCATAMRKGMEDDGCRQHLVLKRSIDVEGLATVSTTRVQTPEAAHAETRSVG